MNFFKRAKSTQSIILIVIIWLFANPITIFADTLDEIYSNWKRGNYQQVVQPAFDYFHQVKRTKKVAYWLGTSLCRINMKSNGKDWLSAVLRAKNTRAQNTLVILEMARCSGQDAPRELPSGWVGSDGNLKDMEIRGDPLTKIPSGSLLFESDDRISDRTLARRLVSKNNPDRAISSVEYSLTNIYKGDSEITDDDYSQDAHSRRKEFSDLYEENQIKSFQASENIILTCVACAHTQEELTAISQGLESYINFFAQEFGMKKPEWFIKIYGATNDHYFQSLAEQLHGVRVGFRIIGYSIPEDLSMVIIFPHWDRTLYGTSKHELFHLMIRDDFGDAPPWIEEGMAALYEGSFIKEKRVFGTQNWREVGLRSRLNTRPTIKQLIEMDWSQFNSETESEDDQYSKIGVIHATARYFMMYLERKGKLAEVYKKMREMKVIDTFKLFKPEAKTVLEESMRMSINQIDKDFSNWFAKLPDITLKKTKKTTKKRKLK